MIHPPFDVSIKVCRESRLGDSFCLYSSELQLIYESNTEILF